jgi:hypothetical protein
MYQDYIDRIKETYEEMRSSNTPKPRLAQPTLSRLREECVDVFIARFDKKDENVLREFFRHTGDIKTLGETIDGFDLSKFKPLLYFLQDKNKNPDKKHIELLAWLLDFKPRPFVLGENYDRNRGDKKGTANTQAGNGGVATVPGTRKDNPDPPPTKERKIPSAKGRSKKRKLIILLAILALAVMGYLLIVKKRAGSDLSGYEACMYWAGDHYEKISCRQRTGDTLVIGFDSLRYHHFRLITTPDTITYKSIGSVWYIRRESNREYYTSGGFHPLDVRRQLKPITAYIIDKHILKK